MENLVNNLASSLKDLDEFRRDFRAVGGEVADESIISDEQITNYFKLNSVEKTYYLDGGMAAEIFNNG
jgi:hypothetical protein